MPKQVVVMKLLTWELQSESSLQAKAYTTVKCEICLCISSLKVTEPWAWMLLSQLDQSVVQPCRQNSQKAKEEGRRRKRRKEKDEEEEGNNGGQCPDRGLLLTV